MSTRQVFAVAGTIVGAYFGNPQLGYAIGSAIGGAVDPQIIKGPSLGDIANQTAAEGVPRPIIWALSPPMGGNIIASSEPKILRKRKRQGKGGPKVETEHVYRTYAVGVCEGPITRFVRVWRNNTLVYDVSEFPLKTFEENVEFMTHARFFLGSWSQEPSPALERVFGVGTTPSHRGTAYMVMDDEELTDLRGAIPQYMFQVERCEGWFLTSRPYPLEDTGALNSTITPGDGWQMTAGREGVSSTIEIVDGNLYGTLEAYTAEDHAIDSTLEPTGGEIYGTLEAYTGAAEGIDATIEPIDGDLYGGLITYDAAAEGLDSTLAILSGELT